MSLVKSKQRVADHGEVFTPAWMVEAMLDLVKDESERIDSRFLEPACGSGNFIVQILKHKLAAVELKFGKSDFERQHYALLGLMCIYGIELLVDNIAECRANVLDGIENLRELLVISGFHGLNAAGQVAVGVHQAAQLNKRAHDGDIDLNSSLGAQHAGEHGNALLGKCVRNGATPAMYACSHNL